MNLHALPGGRLGRPSRSGQPWTEEDYEGLVAMTRDRLELEEIATRLGRTEVAVLDRARRMLPVTERGLPRDRTVTRLRELLDADPAYDWSAAMRQAPPPLPVEHRVYAREGIDALRRAELLAVAEAFVLQEHGDVGLRHQVLLAVEERGLMSELERLVGAGMVGRARAAADRRAGELVPPWTSRAELDRPYCDADCPAEDVPPAPEDEPGWW